MTVPALSAAKALCDIRDWKVSNLELQKILYLSHMIHMGQNEGRPLVDASFEAWDYGPVIPEVYTYVRGFGSGPIPNIFHWIDDISVDRSEWKTIKDVSDSTRRYSPGQLVSLTHRDKGAWSRFYSPGAKGIRIPNSAILEEYNERLIRGRTNREPQLDHSVGAA